MHLALGLIETKGLVGAIEAADAMCKAANVKLVSKEKVTGALIVIKIVGEVAAVKSAVDAGSAAAQRVGQLVSSHVIPRPDDQIESIVYEKDLEPVKKKEKATPKVEEVEVEDDELTLTDELDDEVEEIDIEEKDEIDETLTEEETDEPEDQFDLGYQEETGDIPAKSELQKLNVHELRKLARSFESFPIKGRDISKANRQELIDHFDSLR